MAGSYGIGVLDCARASTGFGRGGRIASATRGDVPADGARPVINGVASACRLTATEAVQQIVDGVLSPIDLVGAVLGRLGEVDRTLRVLAERMDAQAWAAAEEAQAAIERGDALGALHGIPVTVKDNIAVAGVAMRDGSSADPAYVPAADALPVKRLKAAGAIIVGKTTLPEFALKVLTDTAASDTTRNPWSTRHTPGGTSGGAGAALAAGAGPLALGTDGGGFIRCPASCTGTVGLKPTLGRVPNESAPDGFGNLSVTGPMARTVQDVRLLLSVIQGRSDDDPYASGMPAASPFLRNGPIRIGWVRNFGGYRTDPGVADITEGAVRCLADEVASAQAIEPACFAGLFPTYQVLATAAHAARFGHLADQVPSRLTAAEQESVATGRRWSAVELLNAQNRRTTLFRSVQALFAEFDVIATPTLLAPPPEVDEGGSIATEWYGEWAAPLYPFNMTGHPAVSIPAGFTGEGLPVGLQLIGRWHADYRLLDLAAELQDVLALPNLAPPAIRLLRRA